MNNRAKSSGRLQSDPNESHGAAPSFTRWTPRNAVLVTLTVLGILATFVLAWRFQGVLFSLLVAVMLHIALKPSVDRLRRRGVRPELGMLVVYLVVFAFIAGFIALLAPFIANQVTTIFARLPVYYTELRAALIEAGGMLQPVAQSLPQDISTILLTGLPTENEPAQAMSPFDVGNSLIYAVAAFIGIFLMAYYWAIEGERITYSLLLRAPAAQRDGIRELIGEMESKVGAFYRGQLILCAFVGLFQLIAYLVIGLPYALVLALLAFIGEAIPLIGPALGAIPAIIVALAIAPDKAALVIIATIIIQQIENNILVPRVMDRAVGVNPIVSILSIIAFGALFGLVGALLAIPIAAIIQILLNRALFATQMANAEAAFAAGAEPGADMRSAAVGRDRIDVLRMEAREIAEDVRKQLRSGSADNAPSHDVDHAEQEVEDMIESIAIDLETMLAESQEKRAGEGLTATTNTEAAK